MQRSRKHAPSPKELELRNIQAVVDALNSRSPAADLLRALTTQWQKSGPNTERLFNSEPDLRFRLSEVWRNLTTLEGTRTGAVRLQRLRGDIGQSAEDYEGGTQTRADGFFITLLTSSFWHRLAGPCARCGRYYLKKKVSQTVYCSRQCGNAATAAKRTKEKFEEARRKKLSRLRAATAAWNPARSGGQDWRRWIAGRAKVDLRFVASAIRNQEIETPKGE